MKFLSFIRWLTGIWAFALGLRYGLEMLAADGPWLAVPVIPVNIYFDFITLCILGSILMVSEIVFFAKEKMEVKEEWEWKRYKKERLI